MTSNPSEGPGFVLIPELPGFEPIRLGSSSRRTADNAPFIEPTSEARRAASLHPPMVRLRANRELAICYASALNQLRAAVCALLGVPAEVPLNPRRAVVAAHNALTATGSLPPILRLPATAQYDGPFGGLLTAGEWIDLLTELSDVTDTTRSWLVAATQPMSPLDFDDEWEPLPLKVQVWALAPPHSILAYREGTHHAVYVDAAHVYHVGGHAPPGAEPVPEGGHFLNVPRWTPEAADAVYPYADEFAFCTHNACDGSTCEAITRSVATYAPADQLLVPRFGRMSTGGRAPRERSRPE